MDILLASKPITLASEISLSNKVLKMKKHLITIIICSLFPFICIAQVVGLKNGKQIRYETKVILGGGDIIQGTLYQIKDSSLIIADKYTNSRNLSSGIFYKNNVPYNKIYIIEIDKKEFRSEFPLLGAVAGFTIGFLIGSAVDNKDASKPGMNFFPNLGKGIGSALGSIIGVVAGLPFGEKTTKTQFPVYGDFQIFNESKDRLIEYSYITDNYLGD